MTTLFVILPVIGVIISSATILITSILVSFINGFASPMFIRRWNKRNDLEYVYEKYSAPLRLSAHELAFRMFSILNDSPKSYLSMSVFESSPSTPAKNLDDDPYHLRYRFLSSVYRLCAFLGWLELYRQETVYLRPGEANNTRSLQESIDRVRTFLATGTLGKSPSHWNNWVDMFQNEFSKREYGRELNWEEWYDVSIYREEIRAIGEAMIVGEGDRRTVMGFARFSEEYDSDEENLTQRWAAVACNLFMDLGQRPRDFRLIRLSQFLIAVVSLMRNLDEKAVDPHLIELQVELDQRLSDHDYLALQILRIDDIP